MHEVTLRQLKIELEELNKELERFNGVISRLNPTTRQLIFGSAITDKRGELNWSPRYESFAQDLDFLNRSIEENCLDELLVPKGSRRRRLSKKLAASYAHFLMVKYSRTPPTLTKEGPFLRVASLLFEAATGEILRLDPILPIRFLAHTRPEFFLRV